MIGGHAQVVARAAVPAAEVITIRACMASREETEAVEGAKPDYDAVKGRRFLSGGVNQPESEWTFSRSKTRSFLWAR